MFLTPRLAHLRCPLEVRQAEALKTDHRQVICIEAERALDLRSDVVQAEEGKDCDEGEEAAQVPVAATHSLAYPSLARL